MNASTTVKAFIFLMASLIIAGCQPSPEIVGREVSNQLIQQINTALQTKPGDVIIDNVVAINESGSRYQGVANITVYGGKASLKLSILADKAHVIFETSPDDWQAFVATAYDQKFKPVAAEGAYSAIAESNATIFSSFPDTLQKDRKLFAKLLATVSPVRSEKDYWIGNGCRAHECGLNEAAWAINRTNGRGYAILFETKASESRFAVYGSDEQHIPPPLLTWALEKGMTLSNVAVILPQD